MGDSYFQEAYTARQAFMLDNHISQGGVQMKWVFGSRSRRRKMAQAQKTSLQEETSPQERVKDPRRVLIRRKNRIFHNLTKVDTAISQYHTKGAKPPQVLLSNQSRMQSTLQVAMDALDAVRAKYTP